MKNVQRHELNHVAGLKFVCSLCDFTANSHGRITFHERACHSHPKNATNDSPDAGKSNVENPVESVLTEESVNVKYHNLKLYRLLKFSRIRSSVEKNRSLRLCFAATKIQSYCRMYSAKNHVEKLRQLRKSEELQQSSKTKKTARKRLLIISPKSSRTSSPTRLETTIPTYERKNPVKRSTTKY